ncbi:epithelial-stromal interaction protein 1 isoform X2 [Girardinichthys multiradiatus]|uniref:epithelial-stromal interaction protein 1 isoform X2 n=1 Tax=Girardinichthys multiradiatus TaxID=208333 RepID=UPI001FAD4075|nr:epithelial-stromal interaction protein 1 isoform X2 [Girardinichthys multiradiatus]
MNPHPNQMNTRKMLNSRGGNYPKQSASGASGADQAAQNVDGQTLERGNQPGADRQPQYSGAFTVIPPNQSRRSEIKAVAQKEEEELQRWKETHKPPPLQLNPERLGGGDVTLAEARQRQFTDVKCYKIQKKLKKEDMDKKRRQEEEEELQKMKAKQREKSECLKKMKEQEDERRREQLHQDHIRTTESFLQRCERRSAAPSSTAAQTSSMSKKVDSQETDQQTKGIKELQLEHKRVNQAFLDKLECKNRGMEMETHKKFSQEEEPPRLAPDDCRQETAAEKVSLTHPEPDSEQSCSNWTEETGPIWAWEETLFQKTAPPH